MRLSLTKDGAIRFSRMNEAHAELLRRIPGAANPENDERARARLYPAPVAGDDEKAREIREDWDHYIRPGLEEGFKGAIDDVAGDLRNMEVRTRGKSTVRTLRVPVAHAESWLSALNQARLVLGEKHGLPEGEEDFDPDDDPFSERSRAHVQSWFYAYIQEFLIEYVMNPGLGK